MSEPLFMYAPHAPGAPSFPAINECIDCVTDWVTRYLGDRTFIHLHNGNPIWGGPNKPTIRKLVSDYVNGIIERYTNYNDTPNALDYRDIYNQLLDSYNRLEYNALEAEKSRRHDSGIISQAAYRADYLLGTNNYFSLDKFLHGGNQWMTWQQISYNVPWGPDGGGGSPPPFNAIFREYIRCFLRLLKALFPDYPDFNGGSKRKNKRKNKSKNKKNKKNKSKRPRRY
jgi:hypothetical protein